jgi:hypothetical protein
MCPNHHTAIDSLEPDYFTVQRLADMKARAEGRSDVASPWANEDSLERFAVAAIEEVRRMLSVPDATEPESDSNGGQGQRSLADRLEESRSALDAAKARAQAVGYPDLGDGPHLPSYREFERAARQVATLTALVEELEAAQARGET